MSWKRGTDNANDTDEENFDEEELLGDGFSGDIEGYLEEDDHSSLLDDNDTGIAYEPQQFHGSDLDDVREPDNEHAVVDEELLADEPDGSEHVNANHSSSGVGMLDTQVNEEEYAEFSESANEVDKLQSQATAGGKVPDVYTKQYAKTKFKSQKNPRGGRPKHNSHPSMPRGYFPNNQPRQFPMQSGQSLRGGVTWSRPNVQQSRFGVTPLMSTFFPPSAQFTPRQLPPQAGSNIFQNVPIALRSTVPRIQIPNIQQQDMFNKAISIMGSHPQQLFSDSNFENGSKNQSFLSSGRRFDTPIMQPQQVLPDPANISSRPHTQTVQRTIKPQRNIGLQQNVMRQQPIRLQQNIREQSNARPSQNTRPLQTIWQQPNTRPQQAVHLQKPERSTYKLNTQLEHSSSSKNNISNNFKNRDEHLEAKHKVEKNSVSRSASTRVSSSGDAALEIEYNHGLRKRSIEGHDNDIPQKKALLPSPDIADLEYERKLAQQAQERERIRQEKEKRRIELAKNAAGQQMKHVSSSLKAGDSQVKPPQPFRQQQQPKQLEKVYAENGPYQKQPVRSVFQSGLQARQKAVSHDSSQSPNHHHNVPAQTSQGIHQNHSKQESKNANGRQQSNQRSSTFQQNSQKLNAPPPNIFSLASVPVHAISYASHLSDHGENSSIQTQAQQSVENFGDASHFKSHQMVNSRAFQPNQTDPNNQFQFRVPVNTLPKHSQTHLSSQSHQTFDSVVNASQVQAHQMPISRSFFQNQFASNEPMSSSAHFAQAFNGDPVSSTPQTSNVVHDVMQDSQFEQIIPQMVQRTTHSQQREAQSVQVDVNRQKTSHTQQFQHNEIVAPPAATITRPSLHTPSVFANSLQSTVGNSQGIGMGNNQSNNPSRVHPPPSVINHSIAPQRQLMHQQSLPSDSKSVTKQYPQNQRVTWSASSGNELLQSDQVPYATGNNLRAFHHRQGPADCEQAMTHLPNQNFQGHSDVQAHTEIHSMHQPKKADEGSIKQAKAKYRIHPLDLLSHEAELAEKKYRNILVTEVDGENYSANRIFGSESTFSRTSSKPKLSTTAHVNPRHLKLVKDSESNVVVHTPTSRTEGKCSTLNERFKQHHVENQIKLNQRSHVQQTKNAGVHEPVLSSAPVNNLRLHVEQPLVEKKRVIRNSAPPEPTSAKPNPSQLTTIQRTIRQAVEANSHGSTYSLSSKDPQPQTIDTMMEPGERRCCKILNLDRDVPISSIRELGERVAPVNKAGRLKKNPNIVIITFNEENHAVAFRRQFHNTEVMGCRIKVEFVLPRSSAKPV